MPAPTPEGNTIFSCIFRTVFGDIFPILLAVTPVKQPWTTTQETSTLLYEVRNSSVLHSQELCTAHPSWAPSSTALTCSYLVSCRCRQQVLWVKPSSCALAGHVCISVYQGRKCTSWLKAAFPGWPLYMTGSLNKLWGEAWRKRACQNVFSQYFAWQCYAALKRKVLQQVKQQGYDVIQSKGT